CSEEDFTQSEGAKINYSENSKLPGLQIIPQGLLSKKGIEDFNVTYREENGHHQLFPTSDDLAIPFDLFSAAFYLVSRYEEYLPFASDSHGRFMPNQSIAFKYGFLETAVVNRYASLLQTSLQGIYPSMLFKEQQFKVVSTIDIDSAFAYRQKGLMRSLGGFAKDVSQFDWTNFRNRFKHILGKHHDPFDTYEYMEDLHRKHGVESVYFILLADYGHNDKGVSWTSRPFQELIKGINDRNEVGIHPGYQSNFFPKKLSAEIKRLEQITHRKVKHSRQHFLMMSFPETFRRLLDQGIENDYSMGYAQEIGFRASIASPFRWYDLDAEQTTNLTVHPFAFMDATLNMYLKLSPSEAVEKVQPILAESKAVGGKLMTLWHNESFGEKWDWKGWKNVLDRILDSAEKKQ
ncbi:MAG: polysaccharide deacetylase family protein, partial [Flavobacteriales bacterium]